MKNEQKDHKKELTELYEELKRNFDFENFEDCFKKLIDKNIDLSINIRVGRKKFKNSFIGKVLNFFGINF